MWALLWHYYANDRKKTPKPTVRKKVTVSPRAHLSSTKRKQTRNMDQEGSFIQQLNSDTVSTDLASSSNTKVLSAQA